MGILNNSQKNASKTIYELQVKKHLAKKDGLTHVIMINSFSKWVNQVFGVEDKYTTQIDNIISSMQKDGYEIVNIEHTTVQNQGVLKNMEGFHTLITYK